MFTILIAVIIVAGNLVSAVTVASGLLMASGVVADTTTSDRLWGVAMTICGAWIAILPWVM